MKILLVSQSFEVVGGSDVMVYHTKRMLEDAGHEVHHFAARTEGDEDDGVHPSAEHFSKPAPANIHKFFFNADARTRLDGLLEREKFDVAHLHIHYGTLTSSIIAPLRRHKVPTVQHLHEYRSFCTIAIARRDGETCTSCSVGNYLPGIAHRCNRGSLLRSALTCGEMYIADALGAKSYPKRFLAVSNFQRDMLVRQGMPADKIFTLHNPVDEAFFSVGCKDNPQGVLFFGRIEDYKGVFDIAALAMRMPEMQFTLAGEGTQSEALKALVLEKSVENLQLMGNVSRDELLPLLQRHLVVIVPSTWNETYGLTAVEAMASGTPSIVSDKGGLPEVIEHGVTGMKVQAGDIGAMELRIRYFHENPDEAHKFGENGRARSRNLFSESAYLTKLLSHYECAVNDSNSVCEETTG